MSDRGREDLENRVVTLHREGISIRALARRLNLARNTVKRIIKMHGEQREKGTPSPMPSPKTPRPSKLDPFIPELQRLLKLYPNITGERLFEEIQKEGFDGGITILRDRLRTLRPRPKVEPVVRFETDPGLQGQMDWSPYNIPFTRTGKTEVVCFSYVLGHSRRQWIDFCPNRQFPTLIRRHCDAFEHFGGVPRQGLYDSEKTVVLRWEAGRPIYNPKFLIFATHYNFRPIACQRRRPQTKGKVESPFTYVEGNFLNGRTFQDLEDMRACARWWLREKSDQHKHRTTGRPPLELFMAVERHALQPLPAHPYDTSEIRYVVCDKEFHCAFETNRYSTPPEYVLEIMVLRATEHEIMIYSPDLKLVATHARHPKGMGTKETLPEHRVYRKERYGLESVRDLFLALGDGSEEFLHGLSQHQSRTAGLHARTILALREQYNADDIAEAMRHALAHYAFDGRSIERILHSRARPRTLESVRNEQEAKRIRSTLPQIEQRPLSEYSDFLNKLQETDDEG